MWSVQYPDQFLLSLQASSIENKQDWIKHIREVIQERTIHLKGALKEPIHIPKTAPATRQKGRRSVSAAAFPSWCLFKGRNKAMLTSF